MYHSFLTQIYLLNLESVTVVFDSLQPMDCSPPGSSVHGVLQASILEWVSMPSVGEGKISLSLLADVISKAFQCIIALMPLALSEDSVRSLSRLSVFYQATLASE